MYLFSICFCHLTVKILELELVSRDAEFNRDQLKLVDNGLGGKHLKDVVLHIKQNHRIVQVG